MRKAISILQRDLKISMKDPMALMMVFLPLVLAALILWMAPGISETTLNFAVDTAIGQSTIDTLSAYTNMEMLSGADAVKERVLRRDPVIGLIAGENGPVIVTQGNETEIDGLHGQAAGRDGEKRLAGRYELR